MSLKLDYRFLPLKKYVHLNIYRNLKNKIYLETSTKADYVIFDVSHFKENKDV